MTFPVYELTPAQVTAIAPVVLSGATDSATIAANTTALIAALTATRIAGGGNVVVTGGDGVQINKTIRVPRNTSLSTAPGTTIKLANAARCNIARTWSAQNAVDATGFVVSGGFITINEPGHPYVNGDQIYAEGFLTNTSLNGPKTVVNAVPGVSYQFAATGANPTNTSANRVFIAAYNPLAGTNFTRTSNVVTVLEAGHKRLIGDHCYIAGLGGTNSFNGPVEITGVVSGVSWTYANTGADETATGTAQLLGDNAIQIDISIDGNSANNAFDQWYGMHIVIGNCSNVIVSLTGKNMSERGLNFYNASDVQIPRARSFLGGKVLAQFDSACTRVFVDDIDGLGLSDDVLAWGVTSASGPFADTAAPCGPANMGTLSVRNINGSSPTGLFKTYATTGYDIGQIDINTVAGYGPIAIGDASAGVSGGTITSLRIANPINVPRPNSTQIQLGGTGFASLGNVSFGRVIDGATSAGTTGYLMNIGSPYDSIIIDELVSKINRTGIAILFGAAGKSFKVLNENTTLGAGGQMYLAAGASAICDNFYASNITHIGTGAGNGQFLYGQSGGYFKNIFISNASFKDCGATFGSNTAGMTHNLYVDNLRMENVGQGFGSDVAGTFNIRATNLECVSVSNNMLQFYVAGANVRFTGRGVKAPNAQWCLFTSTTQIGIDCKEARIDLGASAATPPSQLVPLAGDQVTNSNATGGGVYGRTAAGAWALNY